MTLGDATAPDAAASTGRNANGADGTDTMVVADRIVTGLKGWRMARRVEGERPGTPPSAATVTISAEKGYLREVGNLVFHLSLLGLLIAIAVGKMVGYEGSVIVNAGSQFCSTSPASYDNFRPGLLVDGTDMAPFCVDVEQFTASYTAAGQASGFVAQIRAQSGPDAGTDPDHAHTARA